MSPVEISSFLQKKMVILARQNILDLSTDCTPCTLFWQANYLPWRFYMHANWDSLGVFHYQLWFTFLVCLSPEGGCERRKSTGLIYISTCLACRQPTKSQKTALCLMLRSVMLICCGALANLKNLHSDCFKSLRQICLVYAKMLLETFENCIWKICLTWWDRIKKKRKVSNTAAGSAPVNKSPCATHLVVPDGSFSKKVWFLLTKKPKNYFLSR